MTASEPAPLELQPTLVGETLTLCPLREDDLERLYAVAADPLIWEQHPEPLRYERGVFERFFAGAIASGGAFLVIENASGSVLGSSRYYDWNPSERSVAIGFTFLARRVWGGAANREMKRLMLDHAFRSVDVVWFHVGKDNHRSRRALEKIGGRYSHEVVKEVAGVAQVTVHVKLEARRANPSGLSGD